MVTFEGIADIFGYSGGGEADSDRVFQYIDHADEHTLLNADNSLMGTLRFPGALFATETNRQRNGNMSRLVAFLNAAADDNVEIHIHLVKHDATLPPLVQDRAEAPYARAVLDAYHASIEPDMAVLDWFLTVRVKPRTSAFAGMLDKAKDTLTSLGILPRKTGVDPVLLSQLQDVMRLAMGTLKPFGPVRLGIRRVEYGANDDTPVAFSEIAEFLYLLRTCHFSAQPLTDPAGFLGAGIAAVDVVAVAHTRLARIDHSAGGHAGSQTYAAALGLVSYFRRLNQGKLDDLLALKGRFVMTMAIRFTSRAEATEALDLLRRQLIAGENKAISDTADLIDAMDQVAGGEGESAITRWSLVIHAGTRQEVDHLVSAARTILATAGAKVALEGKGLHSALIAQLPATPLSRWIRPARCNTKQIAVLASMSGYARGPARARWDHHLFRLLSEADTAYDHDLFVGDVGHSYMVAPNGGGKTVWMGMNILACDGVVRRKGGCQIVLDVDQSNHNTIAMLGGRYSVITPGHSGLAPLRGLPNTLRVRTMLRDLIAGLVQMDGAPPPSKTERDGIRDGVDFVMGEMEPHERSFTVIREYMGFDEHGAGERLEPWCAGGELGWVFDGDEHSIDFNTRLVGCDLTDVMNDKRVMPPIANVLLWMASDVMDGRRTVVWCEEAPAYMPTPAFAKPFKGIALRARKRNASFNAISQQPGDMLDNEAGHALIKQARQIIAFRNDKAIRADYCGAMGFTPREFDLVVDGMFQRPYHTVLIKRQDGQSGLCKFDLSVLPEHLAILAGEPKRVTLLRECLQHNGNDPMRALPEYTARFHETAA